MAFIGANTATWQIRYDDAERTIISYKGLTDPVSDPSRKTIRFRDLAPPRAECQLLGVQSQGGVAVPNDPPRAYSPTSVALTDPWFAGTKLTPSTMLPDLVGYAWDAVQRECKVPPLTVLFHYEGSPSNATPCDTWHRPVPESSPPVHCSSPGL